MRSEAEIRSCLQTTTHTLRKGYCQIQPLTQQPLRAETKEIEDIYIARQIKRFLTSKQENMIRCYEFQLLYLFFLTTPPPRHQCLCRYVIHLLRETKYFRGQIGIVDIES